LKTNRAATHFKILELTDVPHSRSGKHKIIVTMILRDLDQLKGGAALRVPLAELGSTKENVRSALNRATRKAKRNVATATDQDFLYVWNVSKPNGA
jgi:hypothetical protein